MNHGLPALQSVSMASIANRLLEGPCIGHSDTFVREQEYLGMYITVVASVV